MLTVPTSVRRSKIHGLGLFSEGEIKAGMAVWTFNEILDQRINRFHQEGFCKLAIRALLNYGYINPDEPEFIVLCGDDARFMNFGDPANTVVGPKDHTGEYILLAARDIHHGEEITVPFDSDADAARKLAVLFD
jgi:SET domain-containing protein